MLKMFHKQKKCKNNARFIVYDQLGGYLRPHLACPFHAVELTSTYCDGIRLIEDDYRKVNLTICESIIRGLEEFYPCKSSIFEARYELVKK
jgi:hypothetical protein